MHSKIFSLFSIRFLFAKQHIEKTNQPLGMLQIIIGTALIYTTYAYSSGCAELSVGSFQFQYKFCNGYIFRALT